MEGLHEALRQQMANTEVVVALSAFTPRSARLLMFQLNWRPAKTVVPLPGFACVRAASARGDGDVR